jgi:Ca-activated chloride channel family protein
VVEKKKAVERYEDAVTDGDTAILLEQLEPGLYSASVGNLMPGETATVRFRYGLLLRWNGDRVRFAMPTTIAPRYGDPLASGLEPQQVPAYALDLERAFRLTVTVRGLLRNARFVSPSHDIRVREETDAAVIALAGPAAMDRDFVFEAHVPNVEPAAAVVAPDREGWVAMASFRPAIPAVDAPAPRAMTIVVDCSGSMRGESIAQAKAALERILDGLRTGDAFDIVAFGNTHKALFGRLTPLSETIRAQARRFVRRLEADMGGTEIADALEAAYALPGPVEVARDLFLITDGEVWDNGSIVAGAKHSGHRIFTVGVGNAAVEGFLRRLAEVTGGAAEMVVPREDMAERIARHFERIYLPRAERADIHWPCVAQDTAPARLTTVFHGDTLHAFAWFADKPEGVVRLEIVLAGGRTLRQETVLRALEGQGVDRQTATPSALPALARIAAARRLDMCERREEALELALRYGLLSEWTGYVLVHVRAETNKAADLPTIIKVPQVIAAGWNGIADTRVCLSSARASLIFARIGRPMDMFHADSDGPSLWLQFAWWKSFVRALNRQTSYWSLLTWRGLFQGGWRPTLADLVAWSVPEAAIRDLHRIIAGGADEHAVVVAFLYNLLLHEERFHRITGASLGRAARRQILKAYKASKLGDGAIQDIESALSRLISTQSKDQNGAEMKAGFKSLDLPASQ